MQKENRQTTIRVASFPDNSLMNPYIGLFYEALLPYNIELVQGMQLTDNWLRENSSEIDAIHFNWPEECWRYARNSRFGIMRSIIGFCRYLRVAKSCGIAIIWTVHNLEHHEGITPIEVFAYYWLAKRSDILITHSHWAKDEIIRRWNPKGRLIVMYHGNYDGQYPSPRPKNKVLSELDLNPDIPMLCCVGNIRKYKGLEIAVMAVKQFRQERLQLVIAGHPHADYDLNSLTDLAQGYLNIRIIPRRVSAQEFADIINASEAVLLPYQKITGSGAFLAAITMGRGVIVSDLPYFREMLQGHKDAGELFEVGSPDALAEAIESSIVRPIEHRNQAARNLAEELSWDHVVEPVASTIRGCVACKRSC